MIDRAKKNIAVAMSGGVDSTVTAALLQQQGYLVRGFYMDLGLPGLKKQVARVWERAAQLGVEVEVVDLAQPFFEEVLNYFHNTYCAGRTPNPCVLCNPQIKFGKLLAEVQKRNISVMATGHYVRNEWNGSLWQLKKGKDSKKDQSYFLCRLGQEQLRHIVFPLGEWTKERVYTIAGELGFQDFGGEESQDICFMEGMTIRDYFTSEGKREQQPPEGEIVTAAGDVVGRHQGIYGYTVGQRRGLGIPDKTPYYVIGLNPDSNQVVVGKEADLWSDRLFIQDVNWVSGEPPELPHKYTVKIRYRHDGAPAEVSMTEERIRVVFDSPQRAITPGQFAVLYDGDVVIGGGAIR